MEWVEKNNATYVFKEGGMIIDPHNPTEGRRVRGRCVAFARKLENGYWQIKRTGPGNTVHEAEDRLDAHQVLKTMAFGK